MKRTIRYEQNYCYLTELVAADLPFIKQWRNEQMAVLRQTKVLTDTDQKKWFRAMRKDTQQNLFAIIDKKNTALIGYGGLTHIDWVHQRAEISFLLATNISKARYRQLFLEALAMFRDHAFQHHKLHKVFTETYPFRKYHIAILEEFGFKRDGQMTDHIFYKGKFIPSLLHYLLTTK